MLQDEDDAFSAVGLVLQFGENEHCYYCNGTKAAQFISEVNKVARQVTVYQRTPILLIHGT